MAICKQLLLFVLIIYSLTQCTQPKVASCEDVLFSKQKNERYERRKFKAKHALSAIQKAQLDNIILDMPLSNLTASADNGVIDISSFVKSDFERLSIRRDTTKTIDSLKNESIKAQLKDLTLETKNKKEIYESGTPRKERRNPKKEKADKQGKAALFLAILAGILFIPALAAAGGGLMALVLLLDIIALGLSISSLIKYARLNIKTGRWRPIVSICLIFGIPILTILLLILFVLLLWNGF